MPHSSVRSTTTTLPLMVEHNSGKFPENCYNFSCDTVQRRTDRQRDRGKGINSLAKVFS